MRRVVALLLAGLAAFGPLAPGHAEDGDSVRIARATFAVGEQVAMRLEVHTAAGETVEVLPDGVSWSGVEVVRVSSVTSKADSTGVLHTINLVVARFLASEGDFQPAVVVVNGADVTQRLLPPVHIRVVSSLGPNDPLEISALPGPVAVGGAESPLLKPAIVLAGVLAVALASVIVVWAVRQAASRPARVPPTVPGAPPATLSAAEDAIGHDPVTAYRALSSVVRGVMGERYGFPAPSLTTSELRRRMESAGVDRWQARLVEGLLEECDAVVYAGYRPALERREADLTMAREIVEAVA